MSRFRGWAAPVALALAAAALVAVALRVARQDEVRRTADAYAAALREHDVTAMVALYDPQATYVDPGLGTRLTTPEQIRDWYWNLFLPSTRFRIDAIVVEDGTAAVAWRWSGIRVWADLGPYTIDGVSLLEIEGGHIVRQTVLYDPSSFSEEGRA